MEQILEITIEVFEEKARMCPQWSQVFDIIFKMKQLMHIVGHKPFF